MTHAGLARALLEAVRAQDLADVRDERRGGAPVGVHPSIDLAVVGCRDGGASVWANVLFSREHPQGLVASIGADAGAVAGITFLADLRDERHVSLAWQPGADWSKLPWQHLWGDGPQRMVAPYPASLLKLMVAVGVGMAVDTGSVQFHDGWTHGGRTRTVDAWCADMIGISCNDSTSAMVALLHAHGLLDAGRSVLQEAFAVRGLHTLRLEGTRPDGGWGNAAGAGVGRIHMTAWDTVRLLWLIDPHAGPAPWPEASPLLSDGARERVLGWLRGQRLHPVLGLPPDVAFAHKTGTTENYASDGGIVQARAPSRRHYLVALLSNLGSRYVPGQADGTTPPALRRLGAAVDRIMAECLEGDVR